MLPEGLTPETLVKLDNCFKCNGARFGHGHTTCCLCGGCLAEYYANGLSLRDIALRAGVSMQRVHQILTNAGIKLRPQSKVY